MFEKKTIRTEKMYIGGEWKDGKKTFNVISPSTQKIVALVAGADLDDCSLVCETAYLSREIASKMPAFERGEILKKTSEKLKENSEEFVGLITEEAGKPITDSKGEVKAAIERLEFGAEEAHRLYGEALRGDAVSSSATKLGMTIRQPLGVILGITPFNYPLYIPVSKIAPAIASGNTVIIKPASSDPTPILRLAKLFEEAGLPKGVLQVVTGQGAEIGDFLVAHPKINMITFTGNTKTGEEIAKKAVLAKLHLELGGKSPAIVVKPCNLNLAVKECVKGAFKYAGQRCDAVSRILVVDSLYDEFISKALIEAESWKMGDPFDAATQIGPLISEAGISKVTELVGEAIYKGAKVLMGGGPIRGLYFSPTILCEVTTSMRIAWEETFGPVVTIIRVKDFEEAIKIANESEFGLDASIFTSDIDLAMNAAMRLESGTVQINGAPAHGLGNFLYGGDESSGMGREGIYVSAEEMTKLHSIVFNPS